MAFKMITDSVKAADGIAGNALANAELIAGEQEARWKDRLPAGQQGVTVEQMQVFYGEELRRRRQVMIDKEKAYLKRLGEIRELREQRDDAVPELRDRLLTLRLVVERTRGAEAARELFFGKFSLPTDATPLARVARNVADRLEDPEFELPAARHGGMSLDRSVYAREISTSLAPMEAAIQDLADLQPLANQALEEKRKAHAAVDEMNGRLARLLEALYAMEGHDVMAARIRPSSHRAKKDAEAADGVADGRKRTARQRQAARVEESATATDDAPHEAAAPPAVAPADAGPRPATTVPPTPGPPSARGGSSARDGVGSAWRQEDEVQEVDFPHAGRGHPSLRLGVRGPAPGDGGGAARPGEIA